MKKKLQVWLSDFTYCLKQSWLWVLVSFLFGVAGIILAILEPNVGDEIFVKIYGKKIYLIFVQISATDSMFGYELFPALILSVLILVACYVRAVIVVSDCLFLLTCYFKTLSIAYLFILGGILGKILAIFLVFPFFVAFLLWYMALKVFWVKNRQVMRCGAGRCKKYALMELLSIVGVYVLLVIGEIVLYLVILGL